jgi:ABC-2 type transport system ATP-binding protein
MEFFLADKVVKRYANQLALNKVSIHVPQASIYGLLGPNGAGKTTLIRIINQITAPDEGTVYLEGRKICRDDIYQIGYLPEERGLYKKMKVGEQALYLAQLKGLSKNEALKRLKHWFGKFEILGWWNKKVEELSKGMQQKVQFITTVLHEPKLLIFDEPFSGFDPINARLLKDEVLKMKEQGATIIFSTHDMASVEELCDYITLIDKGETLVEGSIDDIRSRYRSNLFEAVFEGKVNLLTFTLSAQYKILENFMDNGFTHLKLQMQNGITTNEIIGSLLKTGKMVSFQETLPSMNDIFIRVVEEGNSKSKNNQ